MTTDDFPKEMSRGTGSGKGYTVEARLNNEGSVKVVNGQALGPKWILIRTMPAPAGLGAPAGEIHCGPYNELLTYPAAQALRWLFVAHARHTVGLETRLLEHATEYTFKETAIAAIEVVAGTEENNNYAGERRKP